MGTYTCQSCYYEIDASEVEVRVKGSEIEIHFECPDEDCLATNDIVE